MTFKLVTLTAFALLTLNLNAQKAPEPAHAHPEGTNAHPRRQHQEEFAGGLPLTAVSEEQRVKLQEAMSRMNRKQSEIYIQMNTLRSEITEMAKQGTNEPAIRAKAMELGKAEGDLAVFRAAQYREIRTMLTPEQFEQLLSPPTIVTPPIRTSTLRSNAFRQRLNTVVERTNGAPVLPPPNRPAPPPAQAPK